MKKNQRNMADNKSNAIGQVRIISGLWRGRKLPVLNSEGLRPTGDRVKETLFNWLMGEVAGATVLDCFSGSGSLGFEALSRGAQEVLFLEKDKRVAAQLSQNLKALKTDKGLVKCTDTLQFLRQNTGNQQFDLVFLDPPFHFDLVKQTLALLEEYHWLKDNALVYVETEKGVTLSLSANWVCEKERVTGQVCYRLYRYSNTAV